MKKFFLFFVLFFLFLSLNNVYSYKPGDVTDHLITKHYCLHDSDKLISEIVKFLNVYYAYNLHEEDVELFSNPKARRKIFLNHYITVIKLFHESQDINIAIKTIFAIDIIPNDIHLDHSIVSDEEEDILILNTTGYMFLDYHDFGVKRQKLNTNLTFKRFESGDCKLIDFENIE